MQINFENSSEYINLPIFLSLRRSLANGGFSLLSKSRQLVLVRRLLLYLNVELKVWDMISKIKFDPIPLVLSNRTPNDKA